MSRLVFVFALGAALIAGPAVASAAPAGSGEKLTCPGYNRALQSFGTAPSGEIPIIYNDHHVYSKPDRLRRNRVLGALVLGKTMLVPICNMIKDIGADAVTYDPATKTIAVSKAGTEMTLVVNKPTVIIDGEERPIDVPPEMYRGAVVVPVRLISEQFGAYVYWLQPSRTTIVRKLFPQPTLPPTPPPATPAPTFAPTAEPAAVTSAPVYTPIPCPLGEPTPAPVAAPSARPY